MTAGVPYAEVIGDPIDHSKSPAIHKFWLRKLGIEGEYRAVQVRSGEVRFYLASRRHDRDWRGCNVTLPLKVEAFGAVDRRASEAEGTGAVNCIHPGAQGPAGANTDVPGVRGVLPRNGEPVCIIGAGGAARAAAYALRDRRVRVLARDPAKARRELGPLSPSLVIFAESDAEAALEGARIVVQASSGGMAGKAPLSRHILDALSRASPDAHCLEMVYSPLRTAFLERVAALGLRWSDGLDMLVAQAREAFSIFFAAPAPREHDAELRELLAR
jgi:shikimate dehydrogenase